MECLTTYPINRAVCLEALKPLPTLYATENTPEGEKTVSMRFRNVLNGWLWYPVEFEPEEGVCFGLVQGNEDEWGYFALDELLGVRAMISLQRFEPTSLGEVLKLE